MRYNEIEQTKNGDDTWMMNTTYPWSIRGGRAGNEANAGVFAFNNWDGKVATDTSFRQSQITSKNDNL